MIFDSISKIFRGDNCSLAKAFVGLNDHQVWVILHKSDCLTLMRKDIVADGAELELGLQGLAKIPKASLECEENFPITRFPF